MVKPQDRMLHTDGYPGLLLFLQFLTQVCNLFFNGLARKLHRMDPNLLIRPRRTILAPNKVNEVVLDASQFTSTVLDLVR